MMRASVTIFNDYYESSTSDFDLNKPMFLVQTCKGTKPLASEWVAAKAQEEVSALDDTPKWAQDYFGS